MSGEYRLEVMSDDHGTPLAVEYFEVDAADDGEVTEAARQLLLRRRANDPRVCYGELYAGPEGYYFGPVEVTR